MKRVLGNIKTYYQKKKNKEISIKKFERLKEDIEIDRQSYDIKYDEDILCYVAGMCSLVIPPKHVLELSDLATKCLIQKTSQPIYKIDSIRDKTTYKSFVIAMIASDEIKRFSDSRDIFFKDSSVAHENKETDFTDTVEGVIYATEFLITYHHNVEGVLKTIESDIRKRDVKDLMYLAGAIHILETELNSNEKEKVLDLFNHITFNYKRLYFMANELIWKIEDDLQRFLDSTSSHKQINEIREKIINEYISNLKLKEIINLEQHMKINSINFLGENNNTKNFYI